MNATFSRPIAHLARAAAALATAAVLASCGGGGVSASPSPIVDSPTLTILPATAVMYSGLPTTFVLSGGTGAYIVASSNQAVLPISGGVTGRSVTLVPNPVAADTPVTLTVRDTGNAAPVNATVTVKPGTVNNDLTITPSSTQDASCSPAVCSGGDAEVRVTISQGGIPLAARGVRFEAVSGSFTFIEAPPQVRYETPGNPAVVVTTTDETGIARARIRVTALAPSQTAQVQATDMLSGAYRRANFAIAQFNGNSPAYFTLPASLTFTGPFANVCASQASAFVSVYGGVPPYFVSGGASFVTYRVQTLDPTNPGNRIDRNGGAFIVELPAVAPGATPPCFTDFPLGVTDSTGRTITVVVSSAAGTGTAPATPIAVSTPPPQALVCGQQISLVVTGGTTPLNVGSNHERVTAVAVTGSDRTITVTRLTGDGAVNYPTVARITITDGTTTAFADVVVPANCP